MIWTTLFGIQFVTVCVRISGFGNAHTHKCTTLRRRQKNRMKEKPLSPNIQFLLIIIIKYYTVVCRFSPIQTNVVTVFIFRFRFIVSLCMESDAGCVCVFLCINSKHANIFNSNPTTKCMYTILGERKIIITTITTTGTMRCAASCNIYVPTGSPNRPLYFWCHNAFTMHTCIYLYLDECTVCICVYFTCLCSKNICIFHGAAAAAAAAVIEMK